METRELIAKELKQLMDEQSTSNRYRDAEWYNLTEIDKRILYLRDLLMAPRRETDLLLNYMCGEIAWTS